MKNKSLKTILGKKITKISIFFFIQILIVFAFTSYKVKEGKIDEIEQSISSLIDAHTPMILNELIEEDSSGLEVRLSLINMRHKKNGVHFSFVEKKKSNSCESGYICSMKNLQYFENSFGYLQATKKSPSLLSIFLSSGIFPVLFLVALFFFFINKQLFKVIKTSVVKPIEDLNSRVKTNEVVETNSQSLDTPIEILNLNRSIKSYKLEIQDNLKKELMLNEFKVKSKISSQISHDLASPLAALSVVSRNLDQLPDSKRKLLNVAITRTREVASKLKNLNRERMVLEKNEKSNEHLVQLIDDVILEKKAKHQELKNLQIKLNTHGTLNYFSELAAIEFKRVISNLIENSIEASTRNSKVQVELKKTDDEKILITIKDNGRGIPEERLNKVTQRGQSFDKSQGTGLGLYHAKSFIKSIDGEFSIESEIEKGTAITLTLESKTAPDWFTEIPSFENIKQVYILDDDPIVHQLWKAKIPQSVSVKSFEKSHLFEDEIEKKDLCQTLCLVDYNLTTSDKNGIEVISSNRIQKSSVLVTGNSHSRSVQKSAKICNIKILDKSCLEK